MNYASPEKLSLLAESRRPLERSLLTRIEALKDKLDTFTIVDPQGETIGEIRNLVLYKRRLHLVIVQPDVHQHWRFKLLSSPLVQRISLRDRTISVHTAHAALRDLPEQRSLTNRVNMSAHAPITAPVSQLPAYPSEQTHPLEATKPRGSIKAIAVMEYGEVPKVLEEMADASVERSSNRELLLR